MWVEQRNQPYARSRAGGRDSTRRAPQQRRHGGGRQDETSIGQYRYLRLPILSGLAVDNAKPLIEVNSETLLTVQPETQTLVAAFNYDVKKAGIFSTRIELPEGFDRAEASGDAVESSNVQKNGAKNVLEIHIQRATDGAVCIPGHRRCHAQDTGCDGPHVPSPRRPAARRSASLSM